MPATPVAAPGLGPGQVAAYARGGTGAGVVDVTVDDAALERVRRGRDTLAAARATGSVYGLTTGVGALRLVAVDQSVEEPENAHALRLWRSHAAGVGPELTDEQARATMLVRLHQLLRGGSGVAPELVAALSGALAAGAVPRLSSYGAVGTGDLPALAQLGLTLVGEQSWRSGSVPPAPLAAGDALPFMSSSAMTIGIAALAVTRLQAQLRAAEQVAALSHLALRGSREAYDARVHALKDDPDAAGVAERLSTLLAGPERAAARIQDPFGLRAVPQVHAAAEAAVRDALAVLTAEIGAGAENPLATDRTVLHHGQFVMQRLAGALDGLRAALQPVLTLSHDRLAALLDPALTGLTPFLAEGPPGSSGLMIAEYVAVDVLARAHPLGERVTGGRTVLSLGLEEHASHATQAAWLADELAGLVPEVLACELLAAVRALRQAPDRAAASAPATGLLDRATWEHVGPDHVLGPSLTAATVLVDRLTEDAHAHSSGRSSSA